MKVGQPTAGPIILDISSGPACFEILKEHEIAECVHENSIRVILFLGNIKSNINRSRDCYFYLEISLRINLYNSNIL